MARARTATGANLSIEGQSWIAAVVERTGASSVEVPLVVHLLGPGGPAPSGTPSPSDQISVG